MPGGTQAGDIIATLFEVNYNLGLSFNFSPTSISFYVANDSSNVGVEIAPKIWELDEDSKTGKITIGSEIASVFVPFTINSLNIEKFMTLQFTTGSAVFNSLQIGEYTVGLENTLPNPNGISLILGRDGFSEIYQPTNSSFIYFGQDTNWYSIDDGISMILSLWHLFWIKGKPSCNITALNEIEKSLSEEITLYPYPTTNKIFIKSAKNITRVIVFDNLGREVMRLKNTKSCNFSDFKNGLYYFRVQFEDGTFFSDKVIKQ